MVKKSTFKFHNQRDFELLPTTIKIRGQYKRLFSLACYLPPNMKAEEAKQCIEQIVDTIHEAKRKLDQPMVLIA